MGKTPKPLALCVTSKLYRQHEEVWEKLAEQGHGIVEVDPKYDSVHFIGPNCWRVMPDLEYIDMTIAAIRKIEYPNDKGDEK